MSGVNAEEHLVGHYAKLGDLKADFRNYNLFTLVASLVKGERIVDIGCGMGFFLSLLKSLGKSVIGVEPSEGMRALAREANSGIEILSDLSRVEGRVDAVSMIDVLEHIEDDALQTREVYEVLEDGGEFVIVVPAHPILYGERDRQMGHYRRYTKEGLSKVLSENGFRIESLRHWNALGFLPYLISEKILKKPLESRSRQKGNKMLDLWFRLIENNFDFGFGLSIICVARKDS